MRILICLASIMALMFGCAKEKSELSVLKPKVKANDTTWCVPIGDYTGSYSLVKYIREDNSIFDLGFFNSKFNVLTSEMYSFYRNEKLRLYIVLDRQSKNRYSMRFDTNSAFVESRGNINVFLDSVANKNGDYILFFTYPRIPFYRIKPVFYIFNDTLPKNDIDTVIPELKSNCHILLNVGKKKPIFTVSKFKYEHVTIKDNFELENGALLDTIKNVNYPKNLDLFYTKEIDYLKYPFVKEEE
jgi:hypothetical protein